MPDRTLLAIGTTKGRWPVTSADWESIADGLPSDGDGRRQVVGHLPDVSCVRAAVQ